MANSWPLYQVEIAFNAAASGYWVIGTSALDTAAVLGQPYVGSVYQTIPNVRQIAIRRGRQDELQQIQAGTCTVLLDNVAGDLSFDNAASQYYPNVLPLRQLRVSATWQGVTYRLFTGYIESYTPVAISAVDADMQIVAVDWFKWANNRSLTTSYPAQVEDVRLAAVIADVGPSGVATALDAGEESLLAATLTDTVALSHIQDVTTAEQGIFFVAADGTLTFHNRQHRFTATRSTQVQGRFQQVDPAGAYDAGTLPYVALDYTLDDLSIWNDVRVQATGTAEAEQAASDANSQLFYGQRTYKIQSAVMATGQAVYLAPWLVQRYAQPHPRLRAITLDGDADSDGTLWAQLLSRELGDRIHVEAHAPGAVGLGRDMWVEAVEHDIKLDLGGHVVQWLLSDAASLGPTPWVIGSSYLDSTTVVTY